MRSLRVTRKGSLRVTRKESLQILTAKFGLTHPNTQQVRTNLAVLYDDIAAQCKLQGHSDKVVEYLEKAIALRQSID